MKSAVDSNMRERLARRVAHIDTALAAPWWQPRIASDLDASFETTTALSNLQSFRFWLGMLAIAQALGLVRDVAFGMQELGFVLRGLVVLPVLVLAIVALPHVTSRRMVMSITSLAVFIAIGVQVVLGIVAEQPFTDRYLMGTVFAFSIIHLVMPFAYRQVIAHAIIAATALSLTAHLCKPEGNAAVLDRLDILLPGIVLVAAVGALMMRHSRRRAFLMDLRSTFQAEALEDANRTLGQLLREDTLTGVYNRRHFDETMERLWATAAVTGQSVGLILLDVDRFKSFNDRRGHQAGDTCLKEVAARLSASLRLSDFVVTRYGGEEFAVILSGVGSVEAYAIGERLRQAVADMAWPHPAGGVVTVSVGTAACVPDGDRHYYALVDAADSALYASKEAGRNCVTANILGSEREKGFVAARPALLAAPEARVA